MKPSSIVTAAAAPAADRSSTTRQVEAALFDKILIANRGEIACRIIQTARKMGIGTVAVYSEADRNAQHVTLADEAICIGAESARESYLDISRVVEACRQSGVQAVHPGYGFLSESAEFARRIEAEGLVFIGPGHEAIAAMGDKIAAKTLAIAAKVNVIPGWNASIGSAEEAMEVARDLGYPVMIKASAGGGGRGLRIVRNEADLAIALASCRSEALGTFGDDRVFIERLIVGARHVEVQVLADSHGNCLHLWERECSIQRRHQKLIEEAPSPLLDEDTRTRMCEQAVALAKAADYRSVGTVEFLVDGTGTFYFLEMNTRLQVEHPVTECITGLDLVEQMIRVSAGERLAFSQAQVPRIGWAMECRINADDPSRNFLPSAGRLIRYQPPAQTMWAATPAPAEGGIRVDSGVQEGGVISTHYDSMIGKLIVHGRDRDQCVRMMREALDSFVIRGVSTNVAFQAAVLAHPQFGAGRLHTGFIAEHYGSGFLPTLHPAEEGFLLALAVAVHVRFRQRAVRITGQLHGFTAEVGRDYVVVIKGPDEVDRQVAVTADLQGDTVRVSLEGSVFPIVLAGSVRDITVRGELDGVPFRAQVERLGLAYRLSRNGSWVQVRVMSPRAAVLMAAMPVRQPPARSNCLLAPMPGRLIEVAVVSGQRVRAGERLAVVEAMKMENVLIAAEDGLIASVVAHKGESLTVDQVILHFQ